MSVSTRLTNANELRTQSQSRSKKSKRSSKNTSFGKTTERLRRTLKKIIQ